MKILNNILEAIGNTPIIKLNRVGADLDCNMLVKCEFFNSGGSIKDQLSIDYCNEHEMSMVLTGTRHFKH